MGISETGKGKAYDISHKLNKLDKANEVAGIPKAKPKSKSQGKGKGKAVTPKAKARLSAQE